MINDYIAAFYGDLSIYWYGVTIAAAVLLGIVAAMIMRSFQRQRINDVLFAAIPALVTGLIGARAFHRIHGENDFDILEGIFSPETYMGGGFALYGGLIGGVLAVLAVCLIFRIKLLPLLDAAAPGLAIGICIGRLAAQYSTSDRGSAIASTDWLRQAPFATYDAENSEWLLNVFFFESLWALIIFLVLVCMMLARHTFEKIKYKDGDIMLTFLLMYGMAQCWFEMLRVDALYWNASIITKLHFVRISQALSAVFAAAALSIFILRYIYRHGATVYSVYTVVLCACCFVAVFAEELRIAADSDHFNIILCGQSAGLLIILGLWLLHDEAFKQNQRPRGYWLAPDYWLKKLKAVSSSK